MQSEAQRRAKSKYNAKTYFQRLVRFPSDMEEAIKTASGESINGFIVQAVREKIEREAGTIPEAEPKEAKHGANAKEEKTSAKESAKDKTKAEKLRKSLSNLGYSEADIQKAIERL